MKKKSAIRMVNVKNLVTEAFFTRELKKELNKGLSVFARDFAEEIFARVATKSELKELKNDIYLFKDEILHEILKLREDNTIILHQRERIDDHEERLEKLETHIGVIITS